MSEIERMLSRRALLRGIAGGAAVLALTPLLAACGGDDEDDEGTDATATAPAGGAASSPSAEGSASAEAAASPSAEGSASAEASASASASAEGSAEGDPGTGEIDPDAGLVIYCGRSEELVGPLIEQIEEEFGIEVSVRYGDTAELAAQLLEEGDASPAHVFFAQDAGALGAVAREGLFVELPEDVLTRVDERFRSPDGLWVGVSGRARAVVYNTENLTEADIPASILDFTDEQWSGRLGWAPTNASFQAFVTALRVELGDDEARAWLEGIKANDVRTFESNNPIVEAVINGEIDAGFVNHYYLVRQEAEAGEDLPADNYIYSNGDPGALVNVAGVGILTTGADNPNAREFVEKLLTAEAQQYFAEETFEYPLVADVPADPSLVPLADIQTPDIDLSDLADLQGTLEMLTDVGLL